MKSILSFIVAALCFISSSAIYAQSGTPTSAIDGTYHLLTPERSPRGGTTKTMLMQYVEKNGQKMLVAAACEKGCTPAVYTYQSEHSQKLGIPVFFNSFGIYMIAYDDDSFISAIPDSPLGKATWKNLSYSNFYSKDAAKVSSMNAEKMKAYVIKKSAELIAD